MDLTKLEEELVRDEGEVLHAYQDSLGLLTIGVGQLIDPRGGGISRAASRFMLREAIEQRIGALDRVIPWWRDLTEARQRVLLNMAFNLGASGLFGFKQTLAAVKLGDYEAAAKGMLNSKWARQVGNRPGERAWRLAEMMREG